MLLSFDYLSLLLIVLNVFVFALFIFLVFSLFKHYKVSFLEEERLIKEKAYQKAMHMLDQAHSRSLDLIKSSHEKSKKVISDANLINDDAKTHLHNAIDSLSQEQISTLTKTGNELLDQYKQALEDEKNKGLLTIRKVSTNIEQEAEKEISDFSHVLEEETVTAEHQIQEQSKKDYELIKKRLDEYEKAKMQEIEYRVGDILNKVVKDLFGKTINIKTNEELVMMSLEKAKNEGMFS